MNKKTFIQEMSQSKKEVDKRINHIEQISNYYILQIIRDLTDLSTIYTNNGFDQDHPSVKSKFVSLKNNSFNYLLSCLNINDENEKEIMEDIALDLLINRNLYSEQIIESEIKYATSLQELVTDCVYSIFQYELEMDENEDQHVDAILKQFKLHLLIEYFLWSRV